MHVVYLYESRCCITHTHTEVYKYYSKFGVGPVLFVDLHCTGTEQSLYDCGSGLNDAAFSYHYTDVSIRCEELDASIG